MEIWLDTIDYDVIADAVEAGVISGVTTNPSILAGTSCVSETLSTLLKMQPGPVAAQVTARDADSMIEEGLRIFEFSDRMVVKVPVNRQGLIAIKKLREEGVTVLGTGILFSSQAFLAYNQGASYISPYFSRMSTVADPCVVLKEMADILKMSGASTKILAASVKEVEHFLYCAQLGVFGVTIKPDLYYKLMANHPLVEGFADKFGQDWAATHGNLSIKDALAKSCV